MVNDLNIRKINYIFISIKMEKQKKMEKIKEKRIYELSDAEKQERNLKLSMLEQEAKQFEQQIMYIEQQIMELQFLSMHLDEIDKIKLKSEILASLGRNIFIKTELLSKDLFVDIGAKTVVKKNIQETKKIIENDVKQLERARDNIRNEFQRIIEEITKLMQG